MQHLQKAIPVLASLQIDKTVRFYQEKLGFNHLGWKDENYAVIGRDHIEIHFWKCINKIHPENTCCYIHVLDVETLYKEMKLAGVVHPKGALTNQPWGMNEFAILDEDGNMIKFGEKV